jgi:hypothetical protein
MHGSLILLCALCSVTAGNRNVSTRTVRAAQPEMHATTEMSYATGEEYGHAFGYSDEGEYGCDDCDHGYWTGSYFCRCHSTCNMSPRITYFPEAHGNYYFRPYNHSTIWRQQQIAISWGIDGRNPYSNEIFEGVYERFEQRLPPEEVLPALPGEAGAADEELPVEPIAPIPPSDDELPEGDAPGLDDPQASYEPAQVTPVVGRAGRTTARLISR